MSGPPANLSASELWTALTQIPRPWRVVDFPRVDPFTKETVGQLAIWVLTQEEQIASSAEADRVAKQILKDPQKHGEANVGYDNIYNNEATVQVLFRACRDLKDVNRPAFPSASLLRKNLSVDEISILAVHYMQVQADVGPIVASMSAEDEKAFIGRLAEAGNTFPTGALSLRELERLALSMACQLVSSWTATPSPGLAPASGPSDTSETATDRPVSRELSEDDHVAETA